MTKLILSFLLITVIGISLIGIQESFAADYDVSDEDSCLELPESDWFGTTCEIGDDFTLLSGETLIVRSGVTLGIESPSEIENGAILTIDDGAILELNEDLTTHGTIDNSGIVNHQGGALRIESTGIFNNYGTGEFNNNFSMNISGKLNNFAGGIVNNGAAFTNGGIVIENVAGAKLTNSGTITTTSSSFNVFGEFENTATGIYNHNSGPLSIISPNAKSYGQMNWGWSVQEITGTLTLFVGDDINDKLVNSGILRLKDNGKIVINGGALENTATGKIDLTTDNSNIKEGKIQILSGSFKNSGDIVLKNKDIIDISGGALENTATGKIDLTQLVKTLPAEKTAAKIQISGGTLANQGAITLTNNVGLVQPGNVIPGPLIDISGGQFDNNSGLVTNSCGQITATPSTLFLGDSTDDCAIQSISIVSPANLSNHANAPFLVEFAGTAFDVDGFGYQDVSSNIVWTDNHGIFTSPNNQGNSVSQAFPVNDYIITATITDSAGFHTEATNTIHILLDNDSDGVLAIDGDCNDGNADIYPGATELANGIDDNCDGTLLPEEIDDDADGYAEYQGDCNDDNDQVKPGATELANGIDDNCDGTLLPEEIDDDADGYAEYQGDCNDDNDQVKPGATELANGIDDNCDGTLLPEEIDDDADGYAEYQGDCNDDNDQVKPGATELANGIDDNCDGTLLPEEIDDDADGYAEYQGDCNDDNDQVKPGATELANGIDDNCDGTLLPEEIDDDADGYAEYQGDCNDDNDQVNPGMSEISGNGIDDNCDGVTDTGLDEDGDGFYTGVPINADCHDKIQDPPVFPYLTIDPFEIKPSAPEIVGDGVDNNCDSNDDEVNLVSVDDMYETDGDSAFSVSASGILVNDIRPLYTETTPVVYPIFTLLPVEIISNDPTGDVTVINDGSFTFSPTDPTFGSYTFTYSIKYEDSITGDVYESEEATVTLTQKFCGKDISEFDNVIVGTDLKDNLNGSNDDDLILGLGGNDKINGKKGNDCIYGGDGNDNINGHDGMDEIHGGDGNDKIVGNQDDDKLFGDDGNDNIVGNNGMDEIHGGDGNDKIVGNQDDDKLFGGSGDDNITGNNGMDEIHGGDGNDKIVGNNHDDQLFGDNGDDHITGNNGDDLIDGGNDYDYCKGNNGVNTIINCEDNDKDDKDNDKDDRKDDKDNDKDDNKGKGRK